MTDIDDDSNDNDWIKRTAEETARMLGEHFGDDEDRRFLIARMAARAIFEERPDDLLFLSCVFVRLQRSGLNETSRRELQMLLDGAEH